MRTNFRFDLTDRRHLSLLALAAFSAGVAETRAQQVSGPFTFEVETLSGLRLDQDAFAGSRVVLVDYFGSWSPAAKEVTPAVQELYAKYKQHGLEVLGLAYEGAARDAADRVRKFATTHGIGYHLALGTPALKRKVEGFRGYPTLLVFQKGFEFSRILSQPDADAVRGLETFVREQLELPPLDEGRPEPPAGEGEAGETPVVIIPGVQPAANEGEVQPLPAGVIFKPGDHDKGFGFEAEDADGNPLRFADLAGKPVLLAITSTWDATAKDVAKMLQALQQEHGEHAHVVAASLELRAREAIKRRKIRAFRDEHELSYRIFPAGVGFQKKIYGFSGMPVFLGFDAEGVLVLRESGGALEETAKKISTELESRRAK